MRSGNSLISLLFLAPAVFTTSCGHTSSHEEALTYYTTIALQMKDVVPKVQVFWGQMKQGIITAKRNQDQKLDKTTLDSLKTSLSHIVTDLDTKIKTVNAISKTADNLNFKQAILAYLTETKQLQETSIPKILELLEIGLDKISNQQKEALRQFATKGLELQAKSRKIEALSLAYQKEYKITNDELKKYGL
jgi:hypothetical protein